MNTVDEMISEARSTLGGSTAIGVWRAALVVENPRDAYEFAKAAEELHWEHCQTGLGLPCVTCQSLQSKTQAARIVLRDSEEEK